MIHIIRTLSIEQKIGQLFVIGIGGPDVDQNISDLLAEISPGGICLFARNIRSVTQTRELTDDLRERSAVVPILAIDQEGGLVDRLRRVLAPMPAADAIGTKEEARWLGNVVSQSLLRLGLNMDFAPVVDVIDGERKGSLNGLTSRTFGRTKEETADLAGEFLNALQSNGILGCLKHFPGLGASTVDSHEELPVVSLSEDQLFSTDLYPYQVLIASGRVKAIMVGHAAFPATSLQETDQNGRLLPSSMSFNFISGLLRDGMSYDGLVITDDMEMGAILRNYGIGEACVQAVSAGADMLAICADPEAVRSGFNAVLDAVTDGRIPMQRIEESLQRISTTKEQLSSPVPFDLDRLEHLAHEIQGFSTRATST